MSFELNVSHEREPEFEYRFLEEEEKAKYREEALALLSQYPDNFFTGHFEELAGESFEKQKIVMSFQDGTAIGCLFFDSETNECDFLAVSKNLEGDKSGVARKMFDTIFQSVPTGTRVFWFVNAEDAVFEGKPVGRYFEPARKLYESMGANFTKVEDKFGEGNHAYLVEVTTA